MSTATRSRWERAVTVPLVVLGAGFVVCYSIIALAPAIGGWASVLLISELVVTWAALLVDIGVRLALTERGQRLSFLVQNPVDVLSIVFPLFRGLRVVRLIRGVPYFQRRTGSAVRAEILTYAITYAAMFVYFISLATLQVERDAEGATITSFGTALWWACVTLATVGYGDTYPVTVAGRIYAVALMLGGVAIVGTATALIVSYLGERIRALHEHRDE